MSTLSYIKIVEMNFTIDLISFFISGLLITEVAHIIDEKLKESQKRENK